MDNSISLSFLAGLYLDGKKECDGDSDVLFCFVFFTYSTHSPSTYMQGATNLFYCCNSNFGDFFFHIFISVDYMFSLWWKVCIGIMTLL